MSFMKTTPMDFFLTPDGVSARRVRKDLAKKAPGLYRLAGTWAELMAQTKAVYGLPPAMEAWPLKLKRVALEHKGEFWASSLEVAPRKTLAELDAVLHRLIQQAVATGPFSYKEIVHNKLSDDSNRI